jgi:hypothetical protein
MHMTKLFQLSLLVTYLFAAMNCLVSAAPSAADQSLLRKAQLQFQKHGGVCICQDCRTLREQLKSRKLIPGKLGENPAGKPLFEGPGLTRPKSPSPSTPTRRPVPAKVVRQPQPLTSHKVTTGRPLQPFRNIVFPPMARIPPVITPPIRKPSTSIQNTTVVAKPIKQKTHGVRIADPRPRALAQLAPQARPSLPFGSHPGAPPSSRPPGPPPTFRPPPPSATSGGATGLPGRAVSIPVQSGISGGVPGRPVAIPPIQGLPGRPITSPSTGGFPGRPLPVSIPQPPSTNPQAPAVAGSLQDKIQALIQKGVPPAAINKQTGIVRMNLQGQYLDAAGSVVVGRRPR